MFCSCISIFSLPGWNDSLIWECNLSVYLCHVLFKFDWHVKTCQTIKINQSQIWKIIGNYWPNLKNASMPKSYSYEADILTGYQRLTRGWNCHEASLVNILVRQLFLTKARQSLKGQMGKYFATLRNPTLYLTLRSKQPGSWALELDIEAYSYSQLWKAS